MADVILAAFNEAAVFVKPLIEQIAIECQWPTLYTEIQADCLTGNAYLFTDRVGFIVLKPVMRCCVPTLLIWAAYHPGGNAIRRFHPLIISLAADAGALALEFWTARKGFARVMPAFGWIRCCSLLRNRVPFTVWRKSLCDIFATH